MAREQNSVAGGRGEVDRNDVINRFCDPNFVYISATFCIAVTIERLFGVFGLPGDENRGFLEILTLKYDLVLTKPRKGTYVSRDATFDVLILKLGRSVWGAGNFAEKHPRKKGKM